MHLVVRALDHDAHESERLDLDDLARIARGHHKLHAVRQVLRLGTPSERCQLMRMRRDHALDRGECAALAGNRDLDAIVERRARSPVRAV